MGPGCAVQLRRCSLLLRRRSLAPCHSQLPYFGLGRGSTTYRRRCPCGVVGFHLPLDFCLCGCLFLGEDVVRRSDNVIVVEMCSSDTVAVEVILWW